MKRNKGFTLIELLVVIAIIGLLSSVVMASLSTARDKGKAAAVQSNLVQLRSIAELEYGDTGVYTNFCSNNKVVTAINAAKKAAGETGTTGTNIEITQQSGDAVCHGSATGWVVSVPVKADSTTYFCVDYTGAAKVTNFVVADNDITCP